MCDSRSIDNYAQGTSDPDQTAVVTETLLRRYLDRETRERWARELARDYQVHRQGGRRIRRRLRPLRYAAVAAVVVLGLTIWWVIAPRPAGYQQLAEEYLATHFDYTESRKGLLEWEQLHTDASVAYILGDYATATRKWEELEQQTSLNEDGHFYLGLCYLYQDQPAAAIPHFRAVMELDRQHYREELRWFLALAWLQQDEPAQARQHLERIVADQSWNHDKARLLLQRIPQ
jgi:tetratricopeptide (TPR) repeat protein